MSIPFRLPASLSATFAWSLLASAAALLAGCQATGPVGPSSPYYKVPAGSIVTLNRKVTIPAHTAGVYIQDGRVIEHKQLNPVNEYYVYCRLEVNDVKDTPQTIVPDTFMVHRVGSRRDEVSRQVPLYASLGMDFGFGGDDDGGPMLEIWSVDLYLHSDNQPQVRRLACQHWVYSYEGEYPTVTSIQKTLGDVMTLKLAR